MGLFSSKKKDKPERMELPPLRFPDLPQEENLEPSQTDISPAEASAIKKAVSPMSIAPPKRMVMSEMEQAEGTEKPLFVKVEKYREVMMTINDLKDKLKDAGDILNELSRIKEQEESELTTWQNDLEAIKEKLMAIDKTLFE